MEGALASKAPAGRVFGTHSKTKRSWPRSLAIGMFLGLLLGGVILTAKALYIPVKAEVAQVLLARAFEQGLEQGQPVKPWSWADTAPVARVSVPQLGASEVVLSGGSGEAMAFGPTTLVDDRARGITVLAAHRDTHFTFVQRVLIGESIWLERIDGSTEEFRATSADIVRWDEFSYPAEGGEGLIALTTCYPFDSHTPGPLRYVIWAERVAE